MLLAVHFSQPPEWRWYILLYFFLAGLAGGTYLIGTLLRLVGRPADEATARLCFLLAFPLTVLCPILLTIDLGQPGRFWHMIIDTGAAGPGLILKDWSPMSLGVWGLMLFSIFVTLSFLEAAALEGHLSVASEGILPRLIGGSLGRVVNVVGSVFGLFIAGYTGVLLSVSNQPVWSDTYALGGLFLASGMSGAAALIVLAARWQPAARASEEALAEADSYFVLLELGFLAVLFVTLAAAGQLLRAVAPPWSVLWVIALVSLAAPLAMRFRRDWTVSPGGAAMLARAGGVSSVSAVVVLVGVLALRAAVLWSAQG
jgi:formate-dependent nitrite reductase membrane component NrfD